MNAKLNMLSALLKELWHGFLRNWVFYGTIILFFTLVVLWIFIPNYVINSFFGTRTPAEIFTYIGLICGAILLLGNQYAANRRNLIMEKGNLDIRFKDAAMLLADNSTSANISGIYAMHQIAVEASIGDKNQQGYVKIIHDILCSFVRENWKKDKDDNLIGNKPIIVLQTIVDVLFKNKNELYQKFYSDFSGCYIQNINFKERILTNISFYRTTLTEVCIDGSTLIKVNFNGSVLTEINFDETVLTEVSFVGATLTRVYFNKPNLMNINFDKATLQIVLFGSPPSKYVNLEYVRFEEATLTGVNFDGSTLINVSFLKGKLTNVSFRETILIEMDLPTYEIEYSLPVKKFKSGFPPNKFYGETKLLNVGFSEATLLNVEFRRAALGDVDFSDTKLDNINFSGTILEGYSYVEITRPGRSLELTKAKIIKK